MGKTRQRHLRPYSNCTMPRPAHSKKVRRERKTLRPGLLFGAILAAAAMLFPFDAPPDAVVVRPDTREYGEGRTFYAGRLLVASPGMRDPRFQKTVIVLLRHDESGAFGLVLNRVLGKVKLSEFLKRVGIDAPENGGEVVLHYGGPVEPHSVFILHSTELEFPNSRFVGEKVALSSDPAILRAIALGKGPRRVVVAVGYSGWGPGQLEAEMKGGAWFTAPADEDILFDESNETKWERAMARRFREI